MYPELIAQSPAHHTIMLRARNCRKFRANSSSARLIWAGQQWRRCAVAQEYRVARGSLRGNVLFEAHTFSTGVQSRSFKRDWLVM